MTRRFSPGVSLLLNDEHVCVNAKQEIRGQFHETVKRIFLLSMKSLACVSKITDQIIWSLRTEVNRSGLVFRSYILNKR